MATFLGVLGTRSSYRGRQEVTRYGFECLKLPEILAITAKNNKRSWRVMEKLGMTSNPEENFMHPQLDNRDPLLEHVLYRF